MGIDTPEQRRIRAAKNQSLFREVNEQLEGLAEAFQFISETANFCCECADVECVGTLPMSMTEYEALRANPNQFAVLPGHVYPEVERVVTENERYVVVAKIGEGGKLASEADPRSGVAKPA
jgi:hypothetical protein